ncbi:MAG: BLUF domain-containing protein [Gammaproteobacteria bacterium]
MSEPDLDSLVYVSSAVKLLRPEEIEYLLTRARERNEEYGITGVLLYIGGNFMQYIEGPVGNLELIYKIIREDKQHSGIILVTRETIEEREFGDWSMAYDTKDAQGYVGSQDEKALFERNLELPVTNPSTARIVLHSFWNRSGS